MPDARSKPLTAAKVRAVLRKAGHKPMETEPVPYSRGRYQIIRRSGFDFIEDASRRVMFTVRGVGDQRKPVVLRQYVRVMRDAGIDALIENGLVACVGYLSQEGGATP